MIKINTLENISEKAAHFVEWSGVISMAIATMTGLAELPNYITNHAATSRAEFAYVAQTANINNPLLREREESGPHYITYGVNRTVSRSGRR